MEEDDGQARVRTPRRRMDVRASIFVGLAAVAQASASLQSMAAVGVVTQSSEARI